MREVREEARREVPVAEAPKLPPGINVEELRKAIRLEKARRHLLPFVTVTMPDYHISRAHEYLAGKLEQFERDVREKKSPRLMVFLPPRFGKSELTSRRYPGWLLGRNPDWNVGIVSYGAELAEELSADARRVVLSDEYREVFGSVYQPDTGSSVEIDRSSQAVNHWRIAGRRGGVRAVGVGGALTGRGFQVIVIDDPIKGRKEADSETVREDLWRWYQGTLRTRLEPGGGILLINTRWHHDDLSGRLLEHDPAAWEVVSLPALAEEADLLGRAPGEPLDPERFDADELEAIKRDVGSRDWAAQYQQRPTPDEGAIFPIKLLRREEDPHGEGMVYQFLDTAFETHQEADRSVIGTWRVEKGTYRLIDCVAGRWSFPDLKRQTRMAYEKHRPRAIVIEKKASGQSLLQELLNDRLPVLPYKPDRDKVARAHAVTPLIEAGLVAIPKEAPWLDDYLNELGRFPAAPHDDYCDMTSMALLTMGVHGIRRPGRRAGLRDFRVVA